MEDLNFYIVLKFSHKNIYDDFFYIRVFSRRLYDKFKSIFNININLQNAVFHNLFLII